MTCGQTIRDITATVATSGVDSGCRHTEDPVVSDAWPVTEPAGLIALQLCSVRGRQLLAYRLVQVGTLFALLLKLPFLIDAANAYVELPIYQDFFSPLFSSAAVVIGTYLLTCIAIGFNFSCKKDRLRSASTSIPVIGLSILCIHQGSYNDMTFTTAWWAMLWSLWFAGRIDESDAYLIDRGARLSRTILSVILLGGAAGKWTAEYWSGQVLYEIYFVDRDFWIYNWLRTSFSPDTVREIATWYSRQVVVVETVVGLTLWAMPSRMAAAVGLAVLASIAIFSNYYLLSVLLSLIALAAVGFLVPKRPQSLDLAGEPNGPEASRSEA
ncbi:MAG TPA: hypothetical protein DDZ51_25580 [Planctomycetaceae bacterium]|nr:hypothetical protein [Planctomycetaceae bacterium]